MSPEEAVTWGKIMILMLPFVLIWNFLFLLVLTIVPVASQVAIAILTAILNVTYVSSIITIIEDLGRDKK